MHARDQILQTAVLDAKMVKLNAFIAACGTRAVDALAVLDAQKQLVQVAQKRADFAARTAAGRD